MGESNLEVHESLQDRLLVSVHKPLQTGEFRLLKLENGPSTHFKFVYTTTDDPPPYAALSYTWGDLLLSESIIVDGHSLNVTRNLKEGLDVLVQRLYQTELLLWVDAICINQEDAVERGSQVGIMTDIFQGSKNVWIWLGSTADESDLALLKIKEFGTFFFDRSMEPAVTVISPTNPSIFGAPGSPVMRAWNAIQALLRRPWWNRTWYGSANVQRIEILKLYQMTLANSSRVVQEATCPVKTILFCGNESVEWAYLFATARLMIALDVFPEVDFNSMVTLASFVWLSTIKAARLENQNDALELLDLVTLTNGMACRDPRDKVYALVGIASNVAPGSLVPDYTKSIDWVYQDFVRTVLTTSLPGHKLDFLGTLDPTRRGALKEGYDSHKTDDRPSWMPSWKPHGKTNLFPKFFQGRTGRVFSADRNSTPSIILDDYKLLVKGFSFDRINQLTGISTSNIDPEFEIRWYEALPPTSMYCTNETLRDAGRHTLSSDTTKLGGLAVSRGNAIDFSYEQVNSDHLNPSGLVARRRIRGTMKASTFGRRLLRTDRGLIGIAPSAAKIGDRICVLYGGSVLYVLRAQKNPTYVFIGECYVHGFMDGEADIIIRTGETKEEVFVIV